MSKNDKNEIMRIHTVLEKDRLSVDDGFNELLISDLTKLLKDYFVFNDAISVDLVKEKGGYSLQTRLSVLRIKNLNAIVK